LSTAIEQQPDGRKPAAVRVWLAWFLLLLMPAMFATNHLVARTAPGLIEPQALTFGRWTIAAALLLPFGWRELLAQRAVLRREWPDLLVLGVLGMWFCGTFVYIGARTTQATNIGLVFGVVPVAIIAMSWLLYRESITGRQVAGIVICLGGLLAILAKGEVSRLMAVRFGIGDLWVAGAASSWALYTVLLKYRPTGLRQTTRLAAITSIAVLAMLPATLYELFIGGPPHFELRTLGLLLAAALLPGAGAYWSFSFVLRELGAAPTSIMMYAGPIYSAVMAWAVLGEQIQWYHLLGAALILPGIWLATRGARTA